MKNTRITKNRYDAFFEAGYRFRMKKMKQFLKFMGVFAIVTIVLGFIWAVLTTP